MDDTLLDLIARGVPWPLALEATSTTRIDRDPDRVRTYTLDELVGDEP